jgi:small subunit ribosomal protein S6e
MIYKLDEESDRRLFYERKIGHEIPVDALGTQWKGYILKITGGCDTSGFAMRQGVLTNSRVQLLVKRGGLGFQVWRGRKGERRRKSVRGCIVGSDIAALNCIVVKEGETKIEGLNDSEKPNAFGPKRATKIRKLFNLKKTDDLRKWVITHEVKVSKGKPKEKTIKRGPKIQRLVTPERLRRKVLLRQRGTQRKHDRKVAQTRFDNMLKKKKEEKSKASEAKKVKVEKK